MRELLKTCEQKLSPTRTSLLSRWRNVQYLLVKAVHEYLNYQSIHTSMYFVPLCGLNLPFNLWNTMYIYREVEFWEMSGVKRSFHTSTPALKSPDSGIHVQNNYLSLGEYLLSVNPISSSYGIDNQLNFRFQGSKVNSNIKLQPFGILSAH